MARGKSLRSSKEPIYPGKNTSNNNLVSTVYNSKTLPVDSSKFTETLEPYPV